MDFITGFFNIVIWLTVLSFLYHLTFNWFGKFVPGFADIKTVEIINCPEPVDVQKVEVVNADVIRK